jgi:hypothetical protein
MASTNRLEHLVAKLRGVQDEIFALNSADDQQTNALAEREDDAYEAIGRYRACNLAELHTKLRMMLEGAGDVLGLASPVRLPNGMAGSASTASLEVMVNGLLCDAQRLLTT